jgi:hypothetical protein
MSTVRKTDHVTGWSAVGVLATIAITKTLTALVMSFAITWLVRHIFAGAPLRFVFGADGLSYWRCVGLFVIWFAARVKIKFSGPALIEIEGDR